MAPFISLGCDEMIFVATSIFEAGNREKGSRE
jgi:hypothetical protein